MSPRPSCGKRRFPDQRAAWEALDRIADQPQKPGEKRPVRAYRCRACRGWHLTSKAFRSGAR